MKCEKSDNTKVLIELREHVFFLDGEMDTAVANRYLFIFHLDGVFRLNFIVCLVRDLNVSINIYMTQLKSHIHMVVG